MIQGMTDAGCMAHARRKFFELQAHRQSRIAALYAIEQEAQELEAEARQTLRETRARPLLEDLKAWLLACRRKIPNGSSSAKAIDYTLKRWTALTHYLTDGRVPIDNNWISIPDPADCHRAQELALWRLAARRQAGGGDHEPDPVGAPQRARALRVSEGCPHPPADSAAEPDRGVVAASVGPDSA